LEKFTGVREPNISDWRRKTFGDLTSTFRFADASKQPPKLPNAAQLLTKADAEIATLPKPVPPTTDQAALPVQEKGDRKRVGPIG
jgi:phospholipase C